jgi:hypothetical protein
LWHGWSFLKARNTLAKAPFGASIRLKCWRVKLDTEYLASNDMNYDDMKVNSMLLVSRDI